MSRLELYSVMIPNKPGKGARLLGELKAEGVNFTGIWGYPVGKSKARIDLVPEDPALLKKAAKRLKIDLGKKQAVFHITGEDHSGVVADVLKKLAAKDIDVYAVQATCAGNGSFGTLIQVDEDSVKKATKILDKG
jgi:predicted amino acid-binding ACT domain protein